ncbi:hypothetical protein MMC25_004159 [Agyrium rufum]|nr:hypothetical protein [Agyrium rufum]
MALPSFHRLLSTHKRSAPYKKHYDTLSESSEEVPFGGLDEDIREINSRAISPFWIIGFLLLLAISTTLNILSAVSIHRLKDGLSDSDLSTGNLNRLGMQAVDPVPPHNHSDSVTTTPTGHEFGSCGSSVAEARALGCIFDPASWVWTRAECYNSNLTSAFLALREWNFYFDDTFLPAAEVPREEWMRGDHHFVYARVEYHIAHCTFNAKKIHAAFVGHRPLDSSAAPLSHSDHCEWNILASSNADYVRECAVPGSKCGTTLKTSYTTCGWY